MTPVIQKRIDSLVLFCLLRVVCMFVCFIRSLFRARLLIFFRYFTFKGQGEGEQPNQQVVEGNKQQGGERGKTSLILNTF